MRRLVLGWIGITVVAAFGVYAATAGRSQAEAPSAAGAGSATKAAGTVAAGGKAAASLPASSDARVARGKYLVNSIGCADCHSPKLLGPNGPEPDPQRVLTGHWAANELPPAPALGAGPWIAAASADFTAWSGPWGTSFAANLTPDVNTGIGIWTEDMFVRTLRTGRHMGQSRPLLPPMPWQMYRNLTDEDLRAIYTYLRTIPPVHNRVPEPIPPPEAPTT